MTPVIEDYPHGAPVRIWLEARTSAGALIDPDTITLTLTPPEDNGDQVITTGIERQSLGLYYYDAADLDPGLWHWAWRTEGGADSVSPGLFNVLPPA